MHQFFFCNKLFSLTNQEDPLYMSYAEIIAKSCGEEEEEGEEEEGGGGEEEGGSSIHVSAAIRLMSTKF